MLALYSPQSEWLPSWDGGRVLFEIIDRGTRVQCAISRMALEAIGNAPCASAADWLQCFAETRCQVEIIARSKLHARPVGVRGRLSLWADDFDDLPPGGMAASGRLGVTRSLMGSI